MPSAKQHNALAQKTQLSAHDKIARMLGILAAQNLKGKHEQVSMLRSAGFEIGEVAEMLNISSNVVSVFAHEAKKKRPKAGN